MKRRFMKVVASIVMFTMLYPFVLVKAVDIASPIDLEVYENVAVGSNVETNANLRSGYPASHAVDGIKDDNSSRWMPPNDDINPQWLVITLSETCDLVQARVYTGAVSSSQSDGYSSEIDSFKLQKYNGSGDISVDANWTDISGAEVSGNTQWEVIFNFSTPVTTDKVRLVVPQAGTIRVFEVELYREKLAGQVDKSQLISKINDIESMDLTIYTQQSKDALQSLLNDAKIVNDDVGVTQEQINNALINLTNGVNNLVTLFAELSNVAFNKSVTTNSPGRTDSEESKAVDGIASDSSRWLTESSATTPQVLEINLDGIYELEYARVYNGTDSDNSDYIVNYKLQYNDGDIWKDIPNASVMVDNTESVNFFTFNQSIITDKIKFYTEDPSTIRIREIEVYGKEVKEVVNKTELNQAIDEATVLYDEAVEGDAIGNYLPGAKAELLNAIQIAETVINNSQVTQKEVNDAIEALQTAIQEFEAKKILVDKGALEEQIEAAYILYFTTLEGSNSGQYAFGAKEELKDAIELAEGVVESIDPIENVINTAIHNLKLAVEDYKDKQVPYEKEDINMDGIVNISELAIIVHYNGIDKNHPMWEKASIADINNDEKIDTNDLQLIIDKILQ